MGAVEGREPRSQRKRKESRMHRGLLKENISPKPWAGKTGGADFHCKAGELEDWSCRSRLAWLG